MGEKENCNSRHFSCLMKSCFPNPTDASTISAIKRPHQVHRPPKTTPSSLSSLPDDLLIEILSRVPLPSLSSLSAASRRFSLLLDSPAFSLHRRRFSLLHPTLFAFSLPGGADPLSLSALRPLLDPSWAPAAPLPGPTPDDAAPSHARLAAIGRRIYIIGKDTLLVYDPWTGSARPGPPLLHPRKRFAAAEVGGRIYVAGGSTGSPAVEEYDPRAGAWRVVSHAPRRRYGCLGVGAGGVFHVIGGLKIGACDSRAEARGYSSSMDLYDVAAGSWLRSRAVPGGGCVVAACGAGGHVYVLTSHAVELSFWRFGGKRGRGGGDNGRAGPGEWCRVRGPPLPAQVRLDGTVRFTCVGAGDRVVLVQVMGCIDDLLRRSGRNGRGYKEGLVLVFDCATQEWSRAPDLPQVLQRASCVCVEC